MKKYFNVLRFNFFFSRIILLAVLPITYMGRLSAWLKPRVSKNGGAVSYFGVNLIFPKDIGINILSKIYWYGEDGFEPYFGKYITSSFRRADVFFDIGSNFGFYSVVATKINPGLHSYCFEPVDFLQLDNHRFHAANNATHYELIDKALGEQDGRATILVPAQKSLRSLITSSTLSTDFAKEKGFAVDSVTIDVQKVDTFTESAGIAERLESASIVVKIDVEGFEVPVLLGARNFFLKYRPIVFIEIYLKKENVDDVLSFAEDVGYGVYAFSNIGLVSLSGEDLHRYSGDRNFVLLSKKMVNKSLLSFGEFELL